MIQPKNEIDVNVLERAFKRIDGKNMEKYLDYLEKDEPETYKWIRDKISNFITELNKIFPLDLGLSHVLALSLMRSYVFSIAFAYEFSNAHMNLSLSPTDEYERWLRGLLPKRYYEYSLRGVSKDSDKYKAKKAHEEMIKRINLFKKVVGDDF